MLVLISVEVCKVGFSFDLILNACHVSYSSLGCIDLDMYFVILVYYSLCSPNEILTVHTNKLS